MRERPLNPSTVRGAPARSPVIHDGVGYASKVAFVEATALRVKLPFRLVDRMFRHHGVAIALERLAKLSTHRWLGILATRTGTSASTLRHKFYTQHVPVAEIEAWAVARRTPTNRAIRPLDPTRLFGWWFKDVTTALRYYGLIHVKRVEPIFQEIASGKPYALCKFLIPRLQAHFTAERLDSRLRFAAEVEATMPAAWLPTNRRRDVLSPIEQTLVKLRQINQATARREAKRARHATPLIRDAKN